MFSGLISGHVRDGTHTTSVGLCSVRGTPTHRRRSNNVNRTCKFGKINELLYTGRANDRSYTRVLQARSGSSWNIVRTLCKAAFESRSVGIYLEQRFPAGVPWSLHHRRATKHHDKRLHKISITGGNIFKRDFSYRDLLESYYFKFLINSAIKIIFVECLLLNCVLMLVRRLVVCREVNLLL